MNYIAEINRFYDWLETNDIPKSAVALWYALMHVNNKAEWKESFEVAVSTLEFKTKFKRSEIFEARNILTQKGRITWKARGGNLAATYEIIPFCVHNTDAKGDTKAYAVPDAKAYAIPTQKHTINKLNKTKQNYGLEEVPEEEKSFPKMPLETDVGELPQVRIGSVIELLRFTRQLTVSEQKIKGMWGVFKVQSLTGQKFYNNIEDVYSHFTNWIKTQNFSSAPIVETNISQLSNLVAMADAEFQAKN